MKAALVAALLASCAGSGGHVEPTDAPPQRAPEVWAVYIDPLLDADPIVILATVYATYRPYAIEFRLAASEPTSGNAICVSAADRRPLIGTAWFDAENESENFNCGEAFGVPLGVFAGGIEGGSDDSRLIGYVLAHEIGHSLGLVHNYSSVLNVMAPALWPDPDEPRYFDESQDAYLVRVLGLRGD